MKTSLKIFLLAVAMAAMPACSAQKRAERHVRKAVALCPELVQVKAHPIDTVLTAPGYADCTLVPMGEVLKGKTIFAATNHGTVVVGPIQADSTLRVGFIAAPQKVRYQDTISYSQVAVVTDPQAGHRSAAVWRSICFTLLGVVIGFVALIVIVLKSKIVD